MRNRRGWVIFLIILAILGIGYAYIPSQGVQTEYDECKPVKRGDTLTKMFGKERAKLATLNGAKLKNPNLIRAGQLICVPAKVKTNGAQVTKPTKAKAKQAVKPKKASVAKATKAPQAKQAVKPIVHKPVKRLADGSLPIATLGVDPYGPHRTPQKDRKILTGRGYTPAEINEYLDLRDQGKCVREEFSRGTKFPWMAFGKGVVIENLTAVWKQPEAGLVCQLESGRTVVVLDKCGNLTEVTPRAPQPVKPPVVSEPPPPIAVEPPKVEPPQAVEPPKVEPPPEEHFIVPVHAKEGDSIPCNAQAGAGVYANRVYKGAWGYGEALCYVFKNGEWQHGPGFYAMAGGGQSGVSSYRNKETGIGLQYGVQRNWINDRGFKSTFEVKARWLLDRMWGSNPDSGYTVNQKGQKFGLYSTYFERHGDNLVGVIGEYWKSFGQTVKSSWSGQPVQDRGSLGVYGVYEHKLGDGDDWRLRWILGGQHTNWDSQNWLRFIPEFRYKETVMFGPQLALPIGVSQPNRPMSVSDLTTVGAFVRVELGTEIRKADATSREEQVEFIPATEAANPSE